MTHRETDVWETPLTHLVVYSLVHFRFVVQNHKGLGGGRVAVEDETKISTLTFHIIEVDEGGVESKLKEREETRGWWELWRLLCPTF